MLEKQHNVFTVEKNKPKKMPTFSLAWISRSFRLANTCMCELT
jgi:hypothetical protein